MRGEAGDFSSAVGRARSRKNRDDEVAYENGESGAALESIF